jgi:membrane fusion protein (multidrug efflux system)
MFMLETAKAKLAQKKAYGIVANIGYGTIYSPVNGGNLPFKEGSLVNPNVECL